MPCITLTTDFGLTDTYVAQMKGVIVALCPTATIVDVTHDIPPQDILAGALALESIVDAFASGSIHIAVVDPGVGGHRRGVAIQGQRHIYVGPDNGLFTLAVQRDACRVAIDLTNAAYHRAAVSATFHGRDIFAPVAAQLAMGTTITQLGPTIDHLTRLDLPEPMTAHGDILGTVLHIDRFGNLITNITAQALPAKLGAIHVGDRTIRRVNLTFADVSPQELVAYVGSGGRLEIAIRNGSAASDLRLKAGDAVRISPA